MKIFPFLVIFLISLNSHAEWLCKEASSKAIGNTFYACGYALEDSLIKSREKSLAAAKREFEAFCQDSYHCRDQVYTVSPLRTDCVEKSDKYSCYRGIEYTILSYKKSSLNIEASEVRKLIQAKEKELSELEKGMKDSDGLKSTREELSNIKKLDTLEIEIDYLKNQITNNYSQIRKNGIAFKLLGASTSLKKDNTSNARSVFLGGISVEWDTPLWSIVSFKLGTSFLFGGAKGELNDRGIPNTNSIQKYHSHKGFDISGSFPLTYERIRISPTIGISSVSYKSSQYSYNVFGIGLSKDERSYKYNSSFVGIGIRYGGKFFVEIEPRRSFKNENTFTFSIGTRFDF